MKNKFKCHTCGGSGQIVKEFKIPKDIAREIGEKYKSAPCVDPDCTDGWQSVAVECKKCNGSGVKALYDRNPSDIIDNSCPDCNSTGYRPLTDEELEEFTYREKCRSDYIVTDIVKLLSDEVMRNHYKPTFKDKPVKMIPWRKNG